jgi:hypothetical protein
MPFFINATVRASKFALNWSRFFYFVWSLEHNEHINSEKVHTFSKFAILLYFSGPDVSFSNSSLTSVIFIVGRLQSKSLLYNNFCLGTFTSLPHV